MRHTILRARIGTIMICNKKSSLSLVQKSKDCEVREGIKNTGVHRGYHAVNGVRCVRR